MSQRHRVRVKPRKPKPFERMSALDMHAKFGIGRTCDGCGQMAGIVKFTTFVLLSDLDERQRAILRFKSSDGKLATVDLKAGRAVQVGQQAACSQCRPEMEKALAHGPSYAFVDIVEAPREVMQGRVLVPVH